MNAGKLDNKTPANILLINNIISKNSLQIIAKSTKKKIFYTSIQTNEIEMLNNQISFKSYLVV